MIPRLPTGFCLSRYVQVLEHDCFFRLLQKRLKETASSFNAPRAQPDSSSSLLRGQARARSSRGAVAWHLRFLHLFLGFASKRKGKAEAERTPNRGGPATELEPTEAPEPRKHEEPRTCLEKAVCSVSGAVRRKKKKSEECRLELPLFSSPCNYALVAPNSKPPLKWGFRPSSRPPRSKKWRG